LESDKHVTAWPLSDGNLRCPEVDDRDVDGTCCLLDALAAPKVSGKKQQDVLSTLAFLTSGSEINAGSVVASQGMATLVPLLGKKSEKIVIGAAKVIANLLISPAGEVRKALEKTVAGASKNRPFCRVVLCELRSPMHVAQLLHPHVIAPFSRLDPMTCCLKALMAW